MLKQSSANYICVVFEKNDSGFGAFHCQVSISFISPGLSGSAQIHSFFDLLVWLSSKLAFLLNSTVDD